MRFVRGKRVVSRDDGVTEKLLQRLYLKGSHEVSMCVSVCVASATVLAFPSLSTLRLTIINFFFKGGEF